jgi:uncharacterized protein YqeY
MGLLKEKLEGDLKTAMRSKDAAAISALRLALSGIKNKEIEERGAGKLKAGDALDDAGVIRVLSTFAKQREESIEMFKKGGRDELVKKEQAELGVLLRYLPSQLNEAEVEKIVDEVIKEVGASGMKDMGAVMRAVMPKLAGQADGKLVNEIVRRKLSA